MRTKLRDWLSIFRNRDHHTLRKAAFDFVYSDNCWNFKDGSIHETENCLKAVYFGIQHAFSQMRCSQNGIPLHFDLAKRRYSEPDPGTTGCLIPVLMEIGKKYPSLKSVDIALRAGEWLITRQGRDGAIRNNCGIDVTKAGEHLAHAFDCVMILQGLLALFQYNNDKKFSKAAHRLANFLISRQKSKGSRKDICIFNYFGSNNTLVGYSLVLSGMVLGEPTYKKEGLACLNSIRRTLLDKDVVQKRRFNNEDLDDMAFLHLLPYIIEGYMRTSELIDHNCWWEKIIYQSVNALHRKFELRKGLFLSHYNYVQIPQTKYNGVTLNAQLAYIWFSIGQKQNNLLYINSALKMMDILRRVLLTSPNINNGCCVPDSFPIYRGSSPFKCNFFAAKYFLEASLLELQFRREIN